MFSHSVRPAPCLRPHVFMKLLQILITSGLLAQSAGAVVVSLGPSTQPFTLTGTGLNSAGSGTSRVTFGTCVFDGTNTTCTLSGSYTGLGSGGAYQFQLVYAGNGPSPLSAITTPSTSNFFSFSLSQGSFSFTLTPTGGKAIPFYDFTESFFYTTSATCTGISTCGVAAVGQSQGGVMTGPVTGTFDVTPVVSTVISASAYGAFNAIAPATWVEIYGTNLATVLQQTWAGTDFNGANAPSALGGTTVTVAGQPAYIDYVSPHQVNVQVPSGIPTGRQNVVVTTAGGASVGTSITVNAVEPGMLAPAAFHLPAGQYAVALFPNGATYVLPPGVTNAVPTSRAKPGDVITLYGIGFGTVSPNINAGVIVGQANNLSGLQVFIGGQQASVQFAGLVQGFLGLYQFNVVVPNVPANDATPLTFMLNGAQGSQSLILAIGN
jgi:uncharacterized protein (TIGR03437 family)